MPHECHGAWQTTLTRRASSGELGGRWSSVEPVQLVACSPACPFWDDDDRSAMTPARRRVIGARARYPDLVSAAIHTAKETVRRLLDDLPDNASLEDIQYHIYVREKIERGLRDVEAGRVVDQDEAKRRMAKWLGE
jgi:predicted transcriptional regulator